MLVVIQHMLNIVLQTKNDYPTYYDSVKRQPSPQQIRRKAITQAAAVSYFESRRIYWHYYFKNGLYKLSPVHQSVHQTCTVNLILVFCSSTVNLVTLFYAVINRFSIRTYRPESRTENPMLQTKLFV